MDVLSDWDESVCEPSVEVIRKASRPVVAEVARPAARAYGGRRNYQRPMNLGKTQPVVMTSQYASTAVNAQGRNYFGN
jgi:hypothetical protein